MRFLNRKWANGKYNNFKTELYHGVYLRHLEDLLPDAPDSVRILAAISQGAGLAGCKVAATKLDRQARTFQLVVKVRTLRGPSYLDIVYQGVDPDSINEHAFDKVKHLLTDELDLAPGERFEHRILLSPRGEFAIQFKDMALQMPRDDSDE